MTGPSAPEELGCAAASVHLPRTVACAVAGLVDLQSFAFAFSRQTRESSAATPWLPGLAAGAAMLQIACLVLLWRGRKAGLYGYLGLAVIYAGVFTAAVGPTGLRSLVPAVLVGAAAAWNWDRLR